MVRALIAASVILILSLITRSEIQVSLPRQVISVTNGTSGNLRTVILRGIERREGEGDGVSWEPTLCEWEGETKVSPWGRDSGEVQCFFKPKNSQ